MENIKEIVYKFNKPFDAVLDLYSEDFKILENEEKEWLGNLENKTNLLKNGTDRKLIELVINNLKVSSYQFTDIDTKALSKFTAKINSIVRIANRINNFKEGTLLEDSEILELYELFNPIKLADHFADLNIHLNSNLKSFLPHLYSVIKHCQNPIEYPIYYKFWKNISKEVFNIQDDYDSFCAFYRTLPVSNRHLNFGCYLGTIGIQIAKEVNKKGIISSVNDKEYKYLKSDVINLDKYLDYIVFEGAKKEDEQKIKKYWIYAPGENAHKWDEFYERGIMGLGWDALGDLSKYESKDEIVAELQKIENTTSSKKNDAIANFEFKNGIATGDVIIVKKGITELLGYGIVTSDNFYDENRESYRNLRKVDWKKKGRWKTDFNLPLKTLTDVTKYFAEHPDFEFYYERLLSIIKNGEESKTTMNPINIPQNLILYGPPGTGKTYRLTNDYVHLFTDKSDGKSKELFSYEMVSELKWWEVITICMYELEKGKVNDLVQHPLMVEKISQSDNSKPRNTIWYWLQNHTKQDCPNVNVAKRHDVQIFWKDENSVWSIDKELIQETLPDLVEKLEQWKNYQPDKKIVKRYEMITFHQSYGYEEFIEGIRPDFQEEEELKYKIEQGVFLRIAEKARKDKENSYAIFIDEINRGNISKIFGELITLIEPDKRQGEENELEVILPYSKSKFSVPPNLFIIGTMNTADRSIALIDTALRRRFDFKEMMPDSSLLSDNIEGINLQLLLDKINERIDFLLDRDHTIGHSYFIKAKSKNEICAIFKNKVIPLLQEYFYNDWEKIQLVLGDNKSWGKSQDEKLVQLKKYYSVEEEKILFGYDVEEYEDEKIYEINPALKDDSFDEISTETFLHIYQKPEKTVQP